MVFGMVIRGQVGHILNVFVESEDGRGSKLDLGDFSPQIVVGKAQVDAGSIDVSVPQLFLKGIKPAAAVEEVDGVAMAEEVGMDVAFQTRSLSCSLEDLVSSLFGDVFSFTRREEVIISTHTPLLRIEQNSAG